MPGWLSDQALLNYSDLNTVKIMRRPSLDKRESPRAISTKSLERAEFPESYPQTTLMLFTFQAFQHAGQWITWEKVKTVAHRKAFWKES